MLNLFTYVDYRQYLKDYYEKRCAESPGFSIRNFSRMAGFGGQSYLKMIMNGQRNLSPNSLAKFLRVLKLNRKESKYFEALVYFNQAKIERDKDFYFERLLALRPKKGYFQLEKDSLELYSNRFLAIIREMVVLPQFIENARWIARSLNNRITPQKVKEGINILLRLGFLTKNKKGRLKQHRGTLATKPYEASLELCNFHRTVLNDAKDAIIGGSQESKEFITVTIPVANETIPEIKEVLTRCRDEIVDIVNKDKRKYSEVYQINLLLFPVTQTKNQKSLT